MAFSNLYNKPPGVFPLNLMCAFILQISWSVKHVLSYNFIVVSDCLQEQDMSLFNNNFCVFLII
jgi:hypothetical protein